MNPVIKDQFGNIVNTSYISNTKQSQAPQKQRGKGGFLSSLISEAGGATGAAGGAAIGSLFGGVGAIPGAIIGGFLGGTGGKAAEQKIRDNQNFFGAGGSAKSAFGEGALSGALSGAGEAYQLAKAGKAITGARTLTHPLENVLAGGAQRTAGNASTGALQSIGKNIEAGGMGMAQGAQATGLPRIGAQTSDELVNTITKNFGIKAGSPEAINRALEPKLAKLGADLTAQYEKSNVAILPKELQTMGKNIMQKVTTQGGLDNTAVKYAQGQVDRLVKTGDIKGLWQFTKELESASSSLAKGVEAGASAKNSAIDIVRNEIRPFLQDKVPGIAEKNILYHQGADANKLLLKATENRLSGGVTGRVMGLAPVKALETKTGRALTKTGNVLGNPVVSNIVRQSPASLSRAIGGGMQPQDQTQMDQSQGQDIYGQAGGQDTTGMGGMLGGTQQTQQAPPSAYSYEQAMRDLQSTNNPKFQQQIMDRYDFVQKAEAARNKPAASPFGKPTFQQYTMAKSGVNSLQQIEKLIKQSPELVNKGNVPGQGIPIVGGYVQKSLGTNQYKALSHNLIDTVLRIRTGAQANAQEIALYSKDLMPQAGDPPETVQSKLQTLYDFLNTAASVGDNQSNLSSAIGGQ